VTGVRVPAQPHGDPASGAGVPGEQDGGIALDGDGPQGEDAGTADGDRGAGDAPDPGLVAEVSGYLGQVSAAAGAAAAVLAGSGDLGAVLAGLDEAWEQAGLARRALRAAAGGKKAPAARPGGLRERVLDHLRAFPGSQFTPHEAHKVLGNSSGAIANALDTLVNLGHAEAACDKPRRFRLAATAPAAAADGGSAGGADTEATELAGAA
jgi:hypothetical protein